jgi:hypothetical protein
MLASDLLADFGPGASISLSEVLRSTALGSAGAHPSSRDPADRIAFNRASTNALIRFDGRSLEELRRVAFNDPDATERERAAWEYADRLGADAAPMLIEVASSDPDVSLRAGVLWLLQKVGADRLADALDRFRSDPEDEVAEWADLLLSEISGAEQNRFKKPLRFDASNAFDQTLPLRIAGHAQTVIPGLGQVQATLSPMWFERIMGRVMACTRSETFATDLIIEKRQKDFHEDGSDYFEIYHFRGVSRDVAPNVALHNYVGLGAHKFFTSGRVGDSSQPVLDDVTVAVRRAALTVRVPLLPSEIAPRAGLRAVVHSVRGQFDGYAYVNVARLLAGGMKLGAGEVQLTDIHHPVAGPLTNTVLFGTFKGKLADLDGDGWSDVNTEPCHATASGELDYNLDGLPDEDPHFR